MKTINYFILRSVIALAIGILLVVWPDAAINYLVITIGVLFLIPGLLALIGYFTASEKRVAKGYFPVVGVGSLLFGLWLIIMPEFFVTILMYVLGFILVLGGLQQIVSLTQAKKWYRVSAGFYVVPVLLLIAGIVVLFNPFTVASGAFMLLGICAIVYAVSDLLNGIKFKKKIDFQDVKDAADTKDVPFTPIE